jgi:hypothetical protein
VWQSPEHAERATHPTLCNPDVGSNLVTQVTNECNDISFTKKTQNRPETKADLRQKREGGIWRGGSRASIQTERMSFEKSYELLSTGSRLEDQQLVLLNSQMISCFRDQRFSSLLFALEKASRTSIF